MDCKYMNLEKKVSSFNFFHDNHKEEKTAYLLISLLFLFPPAFPNIL